MTPNIVQDWLQIGAGVSAAFGVFFLATGLFSPEDREFFAPGLTAIASALISGYVGYLISTSLLPPSTPPFGITLALAAIGLVLGYLIGRQQLRIPRPMEPSRAFTISLIVAIIIISIAFAVLAALVAILVFHASSEAVQALLLVIGLYALVLLSRRFLRVAGPRTLKALGLALSFTSIGIVLIPPIADLLGVPIR
jgi:hypothetical protein